MEPLADAGGFLLLLANLARSRVWGGSLTSRFLRSGWKAGTSKIATVTTVALRAIYI